MELTRVCSGTAYSEAMACSPMEAVVAESHKSLALLLLEIGSLPKDVDLFLDVLGVDKRFPLSELNRVTKPNAGNKDASETEDDDDDDGDDSDDDDDDDDNDGLSGEESDSDGDPEDDAEANGDGGSNDDDDDDDDEDEEDEEDEQAQPPYKKKK